jgi:hypothetical protein
VRVKIAPLRKQASIEERQAHEKATKELADFKAANAERAIYACETHANANEGARDPEKTRLICPAQAGKVRCTSCPMSMRLPDDRPMVVDPPELATAPKACRRANSVNVTPGVVTPGLSRTHDVRTLKASLAIFATLAIKTSAGDSVVS